MKTCPYCAEEIQDAAKVCKHCGRDLVNAGETAQKVQVVTPEKKTGCIAWGFAILFAVMFMGWCANQFAPTSQPNSSAPGSNAPASQASSASSAPSAPATPRSKWMETVPESKMDDSAAIMFMLEAENEIKGWLKSAKPTLVLRCREKRTEAWVNFGMNASVENADDEHTVRIRFDDAPAKTETWSESTDGEALFSPRPIPFAREIARAKQLRVQFTPFNASPQIAEFDVTGFNERIGKLGATCGWK